MFKSKDKDSMLKLVDFGFARWFDSKEEEKQKGSKYIKMNSHVGTPFYLAPEVIKQDYSQS